MIRPWMFCACGCSRWHATKGHGVACSHDPVQLVGDALPFVPPPARGCGECLEIDEEQAAVDRRERLADAQAAFVPMLDVAVQRLTEAAEPTQITEGGPAYEDTL